MEHQSPLFWGLLVRVEVLRSHPEAQAELVQVFPKAGQQRALRSLPSGTPIHNFAFLTAERLGFRMPVLLPFLKRKGDSVTNNTKCIKTSISQTWPLCVALCPMFDVHSLVDSPNIPVKWALLFPFYS